MISDRQTLIRMFPVPDEIMRFIDFPLTFPRGCARKSGHAREASLIF